MELFHRASGMVINEAKLTIRWENMEDPEQCPMADFFNFQCWNVDEGVKYLGFFLKPNDYRKDDWYWLLEKIEKKLTSWSHK